MGTALKFLLLLAIIPGISCARAAAQDANQGRATSGYFNDLVKRAEAGMAGMTLSRSVPVSLTLLRIDGIPVLSYRKDVAGRYGEYLDSTFDCPAPGVLRLTTVVSPTGGGQVNPVLVPGYVTDVQIRGVGTKLDTELPNAAVVLYKMPTSNNRPSERFRVAMEIPASGAIAENLEATGNLQIILKDGKEYLRMHGGTNLNGLKTDLLPLIEHCAKTDPNYVPPPPSVAEIAKTQPIGIYPTSEQLQVALVNYYGLAVGVYMFALGADDRGFEYQDFDLKQCIATVDKLVFCQFSGRMNFGGRNLAPLAEMVNAVMAMSGPRWVSLEKPAVGWKVTQDYRFCDVKPGSIYCDWVK